MVVKKKRANEANVKKGKLKVNKLKVNKETIKDLGSKEAKQIKGGQRSPFETAGCVSVNACGTGWSKCCD